jgi:hypothetical protein
MEGYMSKRIIVILAVTLILGVLLSSSALAGPPWPAEVIQIRDGTMCYFPWVSSSYEIINLEAPGMWVAQYHSGHIQWNCHTIIDFTDPNLLNLDQVCAIAPDYCNGNGGFVWQAIDCYDSGYLTNDSLMVVSPNGNANVGCRFNINP